MHFSSIFCRFFCKFSLKRSFSSFVKAHKNFSRSHLTLKVAPMCSKVHIIKHSGAENDNSVQFDGKNILCTHLPPETEMKFLFYFFLKIIFTEKSIVRGKKRWVEFWIWKKGFVNMLNDIFAKMIFKVFIKILWKNIISPKK